MPLNRREAITVLGSLPAITSVAIPEQDSLIREHDQALEDILNQQVIDASSRWRGAFPNSVGLHQPGSAGRIIESGAVSYVHPNSKYHKDSFLFNRIKLAVEFLLRMQSSQGNIDLLTTNFNSPPDTGFVVEHVARAAKLARMHDAGELEQVIKPFLIHAGEGLAQGGIHTPNHRWVVSAALAQVHELYPNEKYLKRIDAWLAESIDIDAEGQFIERSTSIYNAVSDTAFLIMALKLQRPELMKPVRKNLDAMLYLLHPNFEVVTEISRRQDLNTSATMRRYWFPLRYLAIEDQNGHYATIVKQLEPKARILALLMEYEKLNSPLPETKPIPGQYKKDYPLSEITRIRRGQLSATIMRKGNNRWFTLRWGDAVINAVRFATAFFGKGQFVPETYEHRDGIYHFEQSLRGPYYQPIQDESLLPVTRDNWGVRRSQREQSEVCEMKYKAGIKETQNGFQLKIEATGTKNVPLAIEINLRDGGELDGVKPAPQVHQAFLFDQEYVTYSMGNSTIRIGPGFKEHGYTQLRGADEKLPGPSIYITGYTPFEHTLSFECL